MEKSLVHVLCVFVPKIGKFRITLEGFGDQTIKAVEEIETDEMQAFIDNLKSPLLIGGSEFPCDNVWVAKARENFELILNDFEVSCDLIRSIKDKFKEWENLGLAKCSLCQREFPQELVTERQIDPTVVALVCPCCAGDSKLMAVSNDDWLNAHRWLRYKFLEEKGKLLFHYSGIKVLRKT